MDAHQKIDILLAVCQVVCAKVVTTTLTDGFVFSSLLGIQWSLNGPQGNWTATVVFLQCRFLS